MSGLRARVLNVAGMLLILSATGCFLPNAGNTDTPGDGPGTGPWGSGNVSCQQDSDCLSTESCLQNVCQMRCCTNGPYTSTPPIGARDMFFYDRETAVLDSGTYQGGHWVDGYQRAGAYAYSWNAGSAGPVDVTAGDFVGARPEVPAVATQGSTNVHIFDSSNTSVDVGFVPVAIAAGNVDGSGISQLAALSAQGKAAVCQASGFCRTYDFGSGYTGVDIAVADVDGDGLDEAVVAINGGGWTYVIALNVQQADGEPVSFGSAVPNTLKRVGAGDLDGNGVAEVLGLADGGGGFDQLITYRWNGQQWYEAARTSVDPGTNDLAVSKMDVNDPGARVITLSGSGTIKYWTGSASASLSNTYTGSASQGGSPFRIAAIDFNGKSPLGKLVSGPDLISGPMVPTLVTHFPPYYRYRSGGIPSVTIGSSTTQAHDMSDTVSLHAQVLGGVDTGMPGIFSVRITPIITQQMNSTHTAAQSFYAGTRFSLSPNPDLFGTHYGAVAMSYACYHGYTYQLDDPANLLGGDGHQFGFLVPVDGSMTVWSTTRYNSLASALGTLPIIQTPESVGDPTTYLQTLKYDDGTPVLASDIVFPQIQTYTVSDVGNVGFYDIAGQSQTNATSMNTDVTLYSEVHFGPLVIGGAFGQTNTQGTSSTVGKDAVFGGTIPPLPDNPGTPGDEYAKYVYTFSPVIFRQHWTDPAGKDEAYYVMNFTEGGGSQ